jgi:predicted nucleotidyltransferase
MGIKKSKRFPTDENADVAEARVGLANALFTRTQQRVLALLFGQPKRSFFATELIRLAGAGSGGVQREVARLVEAGLVETKRVGNQKHYFANQQSPIFEELRNIVDKTIGVQDVLRNALSGIQKRIRVALLYGSVAKKSDSAGSDVDVLVISDDLTLEELFAAFGEAERKLGRKINPTLYTSAEFQKRLIGGHPFVTKLLAKGDYIELIGEIDELARA